MSDIRKILTTSVSETLIGTYSQRFELTDYTDSTTALALASGRYESIGGFLYVVENGDYTIDVSAAISDGVWYVHVKDGGAGAATAYLDSNKGTFDPNYGGFYYSGAKVVYQVTKNSTIWEGKGRLERQNITYEDLDVLSNFTAKNVISEDIQTDAILADNYDFNTIVTPIDTKIKITEISAWDTTISYTTPVNPLAIGVSFTDVASSFVSGLATPEYYIHLSTEILDFDIPIGDGGWDIWVQDTDFRNRIKRTRASGIPTWGNTLEVRYDLYSTLNPSSTYSVNVRHIIAKVENG